MTDGKMKDDPRAEVIELLNLVADIREAVGDPTGKLMQSELVERCRELRVKAERLECFEPFPLHKQIKAAREANGLSQYKLAKLSEINVANLWRYEDHGRGISTASIERAAKVLGLTLVLA